MKIINKLSLYAFMILILGFIEPLGGYAHSQKVTEDMIDSGIFGKAGILVTYELTKEEAKDFEGFEGWELRGNLLSRFYPAHMESLKFESDSEVLIDLEGNFAVREKSSKKIKATFERGNYKIEKEIKVNKGKVTKANLIYEVDFATFMALMEGDISKVNPDIEIDQPTRDTQDVVEPHHNTNQSSVLNDDIVVYAYDPGGEGSANQIDTNGEVGRSGAYVHCNRFNGPNGNNTYYSNETAFQTLKNFYNSDCDIAFLAYRCQNDYTSSTNCKGLLYYGSTYNSNPRNCSLARSTGYHPITFHAH